MDITSLHDKLFSDEAPKTGREYIQRVEENIASIILSNTESKEVRNQYMRIISEYAHCLVGEKYYTNALPYLDQAIDLWENIAKTDAVELSTIEFYKLLRFDRAIANYNLKKIKKSKEDLKWLVTQYPRNNMYITWHKAAKAYRLKYLSYILWYIMVGAFILYFLFRDSNILYSRALLCISLGCFLFSVSIEIYTWLNKK